LVVQSFSKGLKIGFTPLALVDLKKAVENSNVYVLRFTRIIARIKC